jgi:ABC-type branched-subunit amino acid transport system substrate-binding protein
MRRKSKVLATMMAASLVIVACGGDDDDSSEPAAEPTAEEPAAEPSAEEPAAEEPAAAGGEVVTDFGVDAENKVIRVGLNADLSGPFSSLVTDIVAGQEVYWEAFNDNGGYQGWTVEPVVLDSGYATDVGIQNYQELAQESADGVVMITENTGSPITSAVAPDAKDDNMLLIPLSWASLWPDPDYGSNVLEKQTTYCNESVNGIEWLKGYVEEQGLEPTLAIVTRPGEYGEDGAAGAKIAAEELGLEIVYDGTSAVAGDDRTAVISELVNAQPTIVWTTLVPAELTDIFGNAVSQGLEAYWSGNSPTFDYKIHLASDYAEQFDQWYFQSFYQAPWATEGVAGMEDIITEMTARRPDLPISDVYTTGWIEGIMAETLFRRAIDDGDLTRAHLVEISQDPSFSVDFQGLSANQSWPQVYDDALVRSSWIYDVDATAFNVIPMSEYTPENPGSSGLIPIERDYVGTVAESYQYGGPCIEPSS